MNDARFAFGEDSGETADMEMPPTQALASDPFRVGDCVHHSLFGYGVVLALSGPATDRRMLVEVVGAGPHEFELNHSLSRFSRVTRVDDKRPHQN